MILKHRGTLPLNPFRQVFTKGAFPCIRTQGPRSVTIWRFHGWAMLFRFTRTSITPRTLIKTPSINTRQPISINKMWINVVHAGLAPAFVSGTKDGAAIQFALHIVNGCKAGDIKSPDGRSVMRRAVLSKAYWNISMHNCSSSQSCEADITCYERTPRMPMPWPGDFRCIKQFKDLIFWERRIGKHPPHAVKPKKRRVDPWAIKNVFYKQPFDGKRAIT